MKLIDAPPGKLYQHVDSKEVQCFFKIGTFVAVECGSGSLYHLDEPYTYKSNYPESYNVMSVGKNGETINYNKITFQVTSELLGNIKVKEV